MSDIHLTGPVKYLTGRPPIPTQIACAHTNYEAPCMIGMGGALTLISSSVNNPVAMLPVLVKGEGGDGVCGKVC